MQNIELNSCARPRQIGIASLEKTYDEYNNTDFYRHVVDPVNQIPHAIRLKADCQQLRQSQTRQFLESDVLADNPELKSHFEQLSDDQKISIWLNFPVKRIERAVGKMISPFHLSVYQELTTIEKRKMKFYNRCKNFTNCEFNIRTTLCAPNFNIFPIIHNEICFRNWASHRTKLHLRSLNRLWFSLTIPQIRKILKTHNLSWNYLWQCWKFIWKRTCLPFKKKRTSFRSKEFNSYVSKIYPIAWTKPAQLAVPSTKSSSSVTVFSNPADLKHNCWNGNSWIRSIHHNSNAGLTIIGRFVKKGLTR